MAVFVHYGDLPLELDDNYAYHKQAQLLLDHGGFYEPFVWKDSVEAGGPQELEPSAGHPPGYVIYLAAFGLVGPRQPDGQPAGQRPRRGGRGRPHRRSSPAGSADGPGWGRGSPTGRA